MEVHHHPELPHGKKKHFKEYFLEFLMIFLAVTMGFIAENIREKMSDHAKEKEYITGLVKNLKEDTTYLTGLIKNNNNQIAGFDSLLRLKKNVGEVNAQNSLYDFTRRYLFYANNFQNNDITLVQIRNSGGYRLIRNDRVLDSIAIYESKIADISSQYGFFTNIIVKTRDAASEVFDLNVPLESIHQQTATTVVITDDKQKIYNYYNQCWLTLISLTGYNSMLRNHLVYTKKLISCINREYDLE